jgi:hypothetical protein
MEETQTALRASRSLLLDKADARAMEKLARKPQLMGSNQLVATVPKPMSGGGEAGLRRVAGSGRGRPRMEKLPNRPAESAELRDDANEMREYAVAEGKRLAEELHKIRGGAYTKHFMSGMGKLEITHGDESASDEEMSGGGKLSIIHGGMMMHGGVGVLPDIEPGYGNPPQAPQSFKRNTVGMGKAAKKMMGCAKEAMVQDQAATRMKQVQEVKGLKARKNMAIHRDMEQAKVEDMSGGVKVDKRKLRGAAISRLMKEKGMTLGQAAKHIKEHGM